MCVRGRERERERERERVWRGDARSNLYSLSYTPTHTQIHFQEHQQNILRCAYFYPHTHAAAASASADQVVVCWDETYIQFSKFSVSRFVEILPSWQKLQHVWQYFDGVFSMGKMSLLYVTTFWKSNLANWSHWHWWFNETRLFYAHVWGTKTWIYMYPVLHIHMDTHTYTYTYTLRRSSIEQMGHLKFGRIQILLNSVLTKAILTVDGNTFIYLCQTYFLSIYYYTIKQIDLKYSWPNECFHQSGCARLVVLNKLTIFGWHTISFG